MKSEILNKEKKGTDVLRLIKVQSQQKAPSLPPIVKRRTEKNQLIFEDSFQDGPDLNNEESKGASFNNSKNGNEVIHKNGPSSKSIRKQKIKEKQRKMSRIVHSSDNLAMVFNKTVYDARKINISNEEPPQDIKKKKEKKHGNFTSHGKQMKYDYRSLFIFSPDNKFRLAVVWFLEWKWFERGIIVIILMNTILLACIDYNDRDNSTNRNIIINKIDSVFTAIFTFECVLKIVEMGFIVHENSYLRDPWNWLDFFVVVLGLINVLPGVQNKSNFKSIRTFRVLRPLRSINAIPSMRFLIMALISSLPSLANVVLFLIFIFLMFGILGVQLFNGALYNRCRMTEIPITDDLTGEMYWPINYDVQQLCELSCEKLVNPGQVSVCGNPRTYQIPLANEDLINDQLVLYGLTTFDNIGYMDSMSDFFSIFYFCTLVFFGAFFLLQLILAVIMGSFEKFNSEIDIQKLKLQKKNRILRKQTMGGEEKLVSIKQQQQEDNTNKLDDTSSLKTSYEDDEDDEEVKESFNEIEEEKFQSSPSNSSSSVSQISKKNQNFRVPTSGSQVHIQESQGTIRNIQETIAEDCKEESDKRVCPSNNQDKSLDKELLPKPKNSNEGFQMLNNNDYYLAQFESNEEQTTRNEMFTNRPLLSPANQRGSQEHIRISQEVLFSNNQTNKMQSSGPGSPTKIRRDFVTAEIIPISKSEKHMMEKKQNSSNTHLFEDQNSIDQGHQNEVKIKVNERRTVRIQQWLFRVCRNRYFEYFLTLIIITNTVVLALDRHPLSPEYAERLEIINSALSWLFFVEMIVKLIGLGVKEYARDKYNIFDAFIVILSIIEDVTDYAIQSEQKITTKGAISSFRAIRLLKVFKLARSWKSFQNILIKIVVSIKDISNFSVLLFLFMYIAALLGMELFANKIKFDADNNVPKKDESYLVSPRSNFDNLLFAFVSIFIIINAEAWNFVMLDHIRGTGQNVVSIYFVIVMVLGHYILLCLFQAILLKNFEDDTTYGGDLQSSLFNSESQIKKDGIYFKAKAKLKSLFSSLNTKLESFKTKKTTVMNLQDSQKSLNQVPNEDNQNEKKIKKRKTKIINIEEITGTKVTNLNKQQLEGRSLFVFGKSNPLRKFIAKIVRHQYFENFILILILGSAIHLAIEDPLSDPNGFQYYVVNIFDYIFTSLFTLETILKIFAYGFIMNGQYSYLRNSWNILDFGIVVLSILSMGFTEVNLQFIKALRMLRVLRPLRMISRNRGLKIAVLSLFNAIPGILNVLLILLFFFLLFGILGTNFFKGKFYICSNDHIDWMCSLSKLNNIKNKWDCLHYGGEWVNQDQNFDNIINAMVTLFTMSTTEGWVDMMWAGVDIPDQIDNVPIRNNKLSIIIYFVTFIIVGSLFFINLFVGVVISSFNNEKEKLGGNHMLSESQKEWVQVQLLSFKYKPKIMIRAANDRLRRLCIAISTSKIFEYFIMITIILNSAVLGVKFYGEPSRLPSINDKVNYLFTTLFALEAIIKIIAQRKAYFLDGWNLFDLFIVLLTLIFSIMERFLTSVTMLGQQTTVFRSFRIFRLFRLVRQLKKLKLIFNTFLVTIPSLANVGGLLLLLFFLYAILGNFLFAEVMLQSNLDNHANFQTFGRSFLTLIRMSTGEGWNNIMWDSARQYTIEFQCLKNPSYIDYKQNNFITNGCGSYAAFIYYISFEIIVTFIFLNLFIAIILEGFDESNQELSLAVSETDIEIFVDSWMEYDPDGTGFININKLEKLIIMLIDKDSPFISMKKLVKNNLRSRQIYIASLRIPTYKAFSSYSFYDVLLSLNKHLCEVKFKQDKIAEQKQKINLKKKDIKESNEKEPKSQSQQTMKQFLLNEIDEVPDYDEIIDQINDLNQQQVELLNLLQNQKQKIYKNLKQHIDQKNQKVFDSSHIIFVPIVQKLVRKFLEKKRLRQRELQSDFTSQFSTSNAPTSALKQESLRSFGINSDMLERQLQQTDSTKMTGEPKEKQNRQSPDQNPNVMIKEFQLGNPKKLSRYFQSTENHMEKQNLTKIEEEIEENKNHIQQSTNSGGELRRTGSIHKKESLRIKDISFFKPINYMMSQEDVKDQANINFFNKVEEEEQEDIEEFEEIQQINKNSSKHSSIARQQQIQQKQYQEQFYQTERPLSGHDQSNDIIYLDHELDYSSSQQQSRDNNAYDEEDENALQRKLIELQIKRMNLKEKLIQSRLRRNNRENNNNINSNLIERLSFHQNEQQQDQESHRIDKNAIPEM